MHSVKSLGFDIRNGRPCYKQEILNYKRKSCVAGLSVLREINSHFSVTYFVVYIIQDLLTCSRDLLATAVNLHAALSPVSALLAPVASQC